MHDEIWCLMRFSMRAIVLTRNEHAEYHIKSFRAQISHSELSASKASEHQTYRSTIKSIKAPSDLRLQLDPIKVSEEREL